MSRWLTPDEKVRELAFFEDYKADSDMWRSAHPENNGGHGYIDHEVLPLVDALNRLDGVCTVQSCCGHRTPLPCDCPGGEHRGDHIVVHELVHPGQLWIRLSEPMAYAFDRRVGDLLRHDVIDHVQKLYAYRSGTEPHDVFDVQWKAGEMDRAGDVIVEFFAVIADVVAWQTIEGATA